MHKRRWCVSSALPTYVKWDVGDLGWRMPLHNPRAPSKVGAPFFHSSKPFGLCIGEILNCHQIVFKHSSANKCWRQPIAQSSCRAVLLCLDLEWRCLVTFQNGSEQDEGSHRTSDIQKPWFLFNCNVLWWIKKWKLRVGEPALNHRSPLGHVSLQEGSGAARGVGEGIWKNFEGRGSIRLSITHGNAAGGDKMKVLCVFMEVDHASDVTGSVRPWTTSVLFSGLTKTIKPASPRGCLPFVPGDLFQSL